ncbi:MAG: hypothetical protein FJY80_01090 [Candidatus Aminicenantes bacterium]|nr:hypothetical protein [Candidatus Aminicenantes bacterium]
MDVYIAREAEKEIAALGLFGEGKGSLGLLLGHTRGKRFFVEGLFVAPGRDWPSLDGLYALDRLFEGRVIGFFAFRPGGPAARALLAPQAVGKAYLEISRARRTGTFKLAASAVDFDGRFKFVPLPLRREPAAKPASRKRP